MDEEQVEVDGVVLDADAEAGVGVEGGDLGGQVEEDLLLVDSCTMLVGFTELPCMGS